MDEDYSGRRASLNNRRWRAFTIAYFLLIAPVQSALRAVPGGVIALEGAAERFVALTVPDGLDGLLEDVPDYALLFIFARASMAKGGETTGEHVAARCDIGQRVGTPTARPGKLAKIPHEAFYRCGGACRVESDAAYLTCPGAAFHQFQLFTRGAAEQ